MAGSSKITINAPIGNLALIFNETILLVNKSNTVTIDITEQDISAKVIIKFVDDKKFGNSITNSTVENGNILITLTNWYTSTWLENNSPLRFTTKAGVSVLVKIRTTCVESQDIRQLTVCIWKLLTK